MSGRLSHFYALALLLACLVTNIAFFEKVREPFLGNEDPMASVKSAFSDLGIQKKIAEFYPKIQSKAKEPLDTVLPIPLEVSPFPRVESPEPRTGHDENSATSGHSAVVEAGEGNVFHFDLQSR